MLLKQIMDKKQQEIFDLIKNYVQLAVELGIFQEDIEQLVSDIYEGSDICPECGGTGEIFFEAYQYGGKIIDAETQVCKTCGGTGKKKVEQ